MDKKCDLIDDNALALIQQRSELRIGDILFASIGRIGDCYLIDKQPKNWNINESVFTIRSNELIIKPIYLFNVLHSDKILKQILNGVTGSTFKSIKIGDLNKIEIPLCNKQEQTKIAIFISNIDKLITLHQRELK